jgi:TRAP-type C4-dicarboxylate transport system permease small subunit
LLRRAERGALVGLFLAMTALYVLNVAAREVGAGFAADLAWIDEAVRLMNLFLVFGALGLALERGRHVSMETFRDRLPPGPRRWLGRVVDAAGLTFSLYLVVLSGRLMEMVLRSGQRSPTLDLAMGWIYLAPVLGFGLLALRFGLSLAGVIDRRAG